MSDNDFKVGDLVRYVDKDIGTVYTYLILQINSLSGTTHKIINGILYHLEEKKKVNTTRAELCSTSVYSFQKLS